MSKGSTSKNAYLEAYLDAESYELNEKLVKVKLIRSLYGLKQAGELWNSLLNSKLLATGFIRYWDKRYDVRRYLCGRYNRHWELTGWDPQDYWLLKKMSSKRSLILEKSIALLVLIWYGIERSVPLRCLSLRMRHRSEQSTPRVTGIPVLRSRGKILPFRWNLLLMSMRKGMVVTNPFMRKSVNSDT
jgi:hypothetical protein